MFSNERHSLYGRQPYGFHQPQPFHPKPPVREDTLCQKELATERKSFRLMLKENPRGRFVRIVEANEESERFNSVMIPASGLKELLQMVNELVEAHEKRPEKSGQQGPVPAKGEIKKPSERVEGP